MARPASTKNRPRPTGSSSSTASRFSGRNRQRAPLRALGVGAAVVVLALFAGWALLASSWLSAQQVNVAGEDALTDQQVIAAAQINSGDPLLTLDLQAVENRVSALRMVASASVHRVWPQTVEITVTERQPVAALRIVGGRWGLLDATGVLFRHARAQPALPVVEGPAAGDRATLTAAATVVDALPNQLIRELRIVRAVSMDSITLQLKDGRVVRWGSSQDSAEKVRVLQVLLDRRARRYDVSVPAQPTTAG